MTSSLISLLSALLLLGLAGDSDAQRRHRPTQDRLQPKKLHDRDRGHHKSTTTVQLKSHKPQSVQAGLEAKQRQRRARVAPLPTTVRSERHHISLIHIKTRYALFDAIGPRDNQRFIQLMQQGSKQRTYYLTENTILKRLNDSIIRDKDLVTSLCNAYKSILHQRVQESPLLKKHVEASYSDYKAVAFAFTKDSPELRAELTRVHEEAGQEFANLMDSSPLRDQYRRYTGIAATPGSWHLGGIGNTADTASLAARYARTQQRASRQGTIAQFDHASKALTRRVQRAEVLRGQLQNIVGRNSKLLTKSGYGTARLLSPAVIEIFRKAGDSPADSSTAALRARFQKRFGVTLSRKTIHKMRQYFALVDGFSASLFLQERVVIDLALAQHGLISVDFAGQGVKNHFQTQMALYASVGQGSLEASEQARAAESRATGTMSGLKVKFEQALKQTFGEGQTKNIYFSGDDGMFMPSQLASRSDKSGFLKRIVDAGGTGSFRVTFLPPVYEGSKKAIPAEQRSQLIVTAEAIEKKIRSTLEGRIPYETLSQLMIGIDLRPTSTGGGKVDVLLAGKAPSNVVAELNQALTHIIPAQYRAGGIYTEAGSGL